MTQVYFKNQSLCGLQLKSGQNGCLICLMCLPIGTLLADSDFVSRVADRDVAGCTEVEMFSQSCFAFSVSATLEYELATVSL